MSELRRGRSREALQGWRRLDAACRLGSALAATQVPKPHPLRCVERHGLDGAASPEIAAVNTCSCTMQAEAEAAERQLADMETAASTAGDAAAFENGVLRQQVADLRKAAHAERQVPHAVSLCWAVHVHLLESKSHIRSALNVCATFMRHTSAPAG